VDGRLAIRVPLHVKPFGGLVALMLMPGCHWSYSTSAFSVVKGTRAGYDQCHPPMETVIAVRPSGGRGLDLWGL
jgi:hypothetical protein